MKKTFKKRLTLFVVTVVMMILAIAVSASAEEAKPCPDADKNVHIAQQLKWIVCEPTCTQKGYTYLWCDGCKEKVSTESNFTDETGHNYKVEYEYVAGSAEDEGYYIRKRVCQNKACRIGDSNIVGAEGETEIRNSFLLATDEVTGEAVKYYEIEYVNEFESPDTKAADHKSYFLEDYYVAGASRTWVLNVKSDDKITEENERFYRTLKYAISAKATDDITKPAPDYEYVAAGEGVKLYLKDGKTAPEYKGNYPLRCKDLTYGAYTFTGWSEPSVSVNGVKTRYATFTPKDVTIAAAYYNYNGIMLSEGKADVYYGKTSSSYGLTTPERKADQINRYVFDGWVIEGTTKTYGIDEKIPLYYDTSIVATFKEIPNEYTVEFVKYGGGSFAGLTDKTVKYGDSLENYIKGISSAEYEVVGDKQFGFDRDERYWVIKAVNDMPVTSEVSVSPYSFKLPAEIWVKNDKTELNEPIVLEDGTKLTIAPRYNMYNLTYRFTVSIKPTYFLDEDVYEDNSILKADILDKFRIQVTDQYGSYIADGTTDKDGNFTFSSTYKDNLKITAVTNNRKYYGEHVLELDFCSYDQILQIEKDGIIIAPKVTQEWLEGLRSCQCICHSILSPLIIRIYNFLNSLFGIKYVCCDDLFIVHGSVLKYTK